MAALIVHRFRLINRGNNNNISSFGNFYESAFYPVDGKSLYVVGVGLYTPQHPPHTKNRKLLAAASHKKETKTCLAREDA
jgi:hypothetical protein